MPKFNPIKSFASKLASSGALMGAINLAAGAGAGYWASKALNSGGPEQNNLGKVPQEQVERPMKFEFDQNNPEKTRQQLEEMQKRLEQQQQELNKREEQLKKQEEDLKQREREREREQEQPKPLEKEEPAPREAPKQPPANEADLRKQIDNLKQQLEAQKNNAPKQEQAPQQQPPAPQPPQSRPLPPMPKVIEKIVEKQAPNQPRPQEQNTPNQPSANERQLQSQVDNLNRQLTASQNASRQAADEKYQAQANEFAKYKKQADELAAANNKTISDLREQLSERENRLSSEREAEWNQRNDDLSKSEADLKRRRSAYERDLKDFQDKENALSNRKNDLDKRQSELDTEKNELLSKEQDLKDWEDRLRNKENELDAKQKKIDNDPFSLGDAVKNRIKKRKGSFSKGDLLNNTAGDPFGGPKNNNNNDSNVPKNKKAGDAAATVSHVLNLFKARTNKVLLDKFTKNGKIPIDKLQNDLEQGLKSNQGEIEAEDYKVDIKKDLQLKKYSNTKGLDKIEKVMKSLPGFDQFQSIGDMKNAAAVLKGNLPKDEQTKDDFKKVQEQNVQQIAKDVKVAPSKKEKEDSDNRQKELKEKLDIDAWRQALKDPFSKETTTRGLEDENAVVNTRRGPKPKNPYVGYPTAMAIAAYKSGLSSGKQPDCIKNGVLQGLQACIADMKKAQASWKNVQILAGPKKYDFDPTLSVNQAAAKDKTKPLFLFSFSHDTQLRSVANESDFSQDWLREYQKQDKNFDTQEKNHQKNISTLLTNLNANNNLPYNQKEAQVKIAIQSREKDRANVYNKGNNKIKIYQILFIGTDKKPKIPSLESLDEMKQLMKDAEKLKNENPNLQAKAAKTTFAAKFALGAAAGPKVLTPLEIAQKTFLQDVHQAKTSFENLVKTYITSKEKFDAAQGLTVKKVSMKDLVDITMKDLSLLSDRNVHNLISALKEKIRSITIEKMDVKSLDVSKTCGNRCPFFSLIRLFPFCDRLETLDVQGNFDLNDKKSIFFKEKQNIPNPFGFELDKKAKFSYGTSLVDAWFMGVSLIPNLKTFKMKALGTGEISSENIFSAIAKCTNVHLPPIRPTYMRTLFQDLLAAPPVVPNKTIEFYTKSFCSVIRMKDFPKLMYQVLSTKRYQITWAGQLDPEPYVDLEGFSLVVDKAKGIDEVKEVNATIMGTPAPHLKAKYIFPKILHPSGNAKDLRGWLTTNFTNDFLATPEVFLTLAGVQGETFKEKALENDQEKNKLYYALDSLANYRTGGANDVISSPENVPPNPLIKTLSKYPFWNKNASKVEHIRYRKEEKRPLYKQLSPDEEKDVSFIKDGGLDENYIENYLVPMLLCLVLRENPNDTYVALDDEFGNEWPVPSPTNVANTIPGDDTQKDAIALASKALIDDPNKNLQKNGYRKVTVHCGLIASTFLKTLFPDKVRPYSYNFLLSSEFAVTQKGNPKALCVKVYSKKCTEAFQALETCIRAAKYHKLYCQKMRELNKVFYEKAASLLKEESDLKTKKLMLEADINDLNQQLLKKPKNAKLLSDLDARKKELTPISDRLNLITNGKQGADGKTPIERDANEDVPDDPGNDGLAQIDRKLGKLRLQMRTHALWLGKDANTFDQLLDKILEIAKSVATDIKMNDN